MTFDKLYTLFVSLLPLCLCSIGNIHKLEMVMDKYFPPVELYNTDIDVKMQNGKRHAKMFIDLFY